MGRSAQRGSYLSAGDLRLHYGLGKRSRVDVLEVHWPDGRVQRIEDVPFNRFVTMEEGKGMTRQMPPWARCVLVMSCVVGALCLRTARAGPEGRRCGAKQDSTRLTVARTQRFAHTKRSPKPFKKRQGLEAKTS